MNETSLHGQIRSLFEADETGVFTSAAGYSHAKYDQYTELSRHIHKQMISILDAHNVEYYLFAGSMVGYVRNKDMPYWMDDLDIIILDENIDKFEETAVKVLKECGFNCFFQERFTGGGYHVLGMQQGGDRRHTIALSETKNISVPWAQIDVFYTTVDDAGFIRNPANWGLYTTKDVPVDWVKPGVFVEFGDIKVRVFSDYEADIRKEYGDVLNNIVIHSHDATYLNAPGVPWAEFEAEFLSYIDQTSSQLPDTLSQDALNTYQPDAQTTYETKAEESFSSIIAAVVGANAGSVRLMDGNQNFWVMDLKRLAPALNIHVTAQTALQAQRAAHLRAFIDTVSFESDGVKAEYERCVDALRRALGE